MTVRDLTDDRARGALADEQDRARAAASPAVLANPAALGLAGFAPANLVAHGGRQVAVGAACSRGPGERPGAAAAAVSARRPAIEIRWAANASSAAVA